LNFAFYRKIPAKFLTELLLFENYQEKSPQDGLRACESRLEAHNVNQRRGVKPLGQKSNDMGAIRSQPGREF